MEARRRNQNGSSSRNADVLREGGIEAQKKLYNEFYTTEAAKLGKPEVENELNELAREYSKKYINKNILFQLYKGYKRLDDVMNLFFFSYQGLHRTSVKCAKLWVGVMQVRTVMTNDLINLKDHKVFLSVEFKFDRKAELDNYVRLCIILVARAVQFLVIYKKHSDETWRFLRKPFLEKLSDELYKNLEETANNWRKSLELRYGFAAYQMEGMNTHIAKEFQHIKDSLLEVQPYSDIAAKDMLYIASLNKMVDDIVGSEQGEGIDASLVCKDQFKVLRVQIAIVEDIIGVADLSTGQSRKDFEKKYGVKDISLDRAHELLSARVEEKVLTDDDRIWPHQEGLKDLGPFSLIDLKEPLKYLTIKEETFSVVPLCEDIPGLKAFVGVEGQMSKLDEVPYAMTDKEMRSALNIPYLATHQRFLYPINVEVLDEIAETRNEVFAGDESPLHIVLLYGGFAYFDRFGKLLSVKGVVFGDDLFFDGPYMLSSANCFDNIDLAPVTISAIGEQGASHFAWIGNVTDLKASSFAGLPEFYLNGWVKIQAELKNKFKGAFFYKYDNSEHPEWDTKNVEAGARRNYFQVLDFSELKLRRAMNANTPLIETLRVAILGMMNSWVISDPNNQLDKDDLALLKAEHTSSCSII